MCVFIYDVWEIKTCDEAMTCMVETYDMHVYTYYVFLPVVESSRHFRIASVE